VLPFMVYAAARRDCRGKSSLLTTEQNGCRTMGSCCSGQFVIHCPDQLTNVLNTLCLIRT